ncbi:MAG: DUF4384 domain-containing protein [Ignavibacteria bacterium]|nr:DUF4384 domain-containing protein [Ignavibacteria bacterium]
MKIPYFVSLLVLYFWAPNIVHSDELPEWVTKHGKSVTYPERLYLTGFSLKKYADADEQNDAFTKVKEDAKRILTEKVRVSIRSKVSSLVEESNNKLVQFFSTATQTTTSLELQELDVLTFNDENEETYYALAFAKKEKLSALYNSKISHARKQLSEHRTSANSYVSAHQYSKALEEYLLCFPLFREIEEWQIVLNVCGTEFSIIEQEISNDELTSSHVRNEINKLVQKPITSLDDAAWYLAYCLKMNNEEKQITTVVAPPTFQHTKMGSAFSRYFKTIFEHQIVEVAKWNVVQQVAQYQPKTKNVAKEFSEASGAEYIVSGTYWEQQSNIKIILSLTKISDSKIVGSAEVDVEKNILDTTKVRLKPENFQSAFNDQKIFDNNEIIDGGLSVELWTNKGNENLLFTENERMNLYVRVNMPCYLRFIYHLANGQRALMQNDYYIDESKVNFTVTMPDTFYCAPPFGVEVLQIIARTETFEKIATETMDGYQILKDDLKKFIGVTRGFKKNKPSLMQTEARIQIMTMK